MPKKKRWLWVEALIDARHELHHGPDRWETWNDVEDFFGAWMDALVRG